MSSDARRKAEDALAEIDSALGDADEQHPERASLAALGPALANLMRATRALLNASDPAAGEREEKGPRCPFCDTARIERDARLDLWVCHVCKRSWAVAEEPATPTRPAQDAVREAAEEAAEALAAYNWFDRDHSTVIADQCAEALRTLLDVLDAAKEPK